MLFAERVLRYLVAFPPAADRTTADTAARLVKLIRTWMSWGNLSK